MNILSCQYVKSKSRKNLHNENGQKRNIFQSINHASINQMIQCLLKNGNLKMWPLARQQILNIEV